MYCNKCGNNVADGLAYCDVCGAELNADSYADEVLDVSPATDPGKTLGIVALILGIVALLTSFVCTGLCTFFIPLGCAIAGIIVAVIGMKKSKQAGFKNTLALIGMILSIAGLVIFPISIIIGSIIGIAITPMLNEMSGY